MRGLRAGGQHVQHFPAFALAVGLDLLAEHELRPRLVPTRIELKASAFERLVDGPSGEDFRSFGDVALRVSAIHAERVQLQQLTAIILVEAAVIFSLRVRIRIRARPRKTAIAIRTVWPGMRGHAGR